MIDERIDRRVGKSVHGVGADQFVDVQGVGVRRILRARGRPERTLYRGAGVLQRVPARAAEGATERVVRQPSLCHRSPTSQCQRFGGTALVEAAIDLGIDTTDEERSHTRDTRRRPTGSNAIVETVDVRLHHLLIAIEPEDESHVDVASLGDHRADGWKTLFGGRNLDHEVGSVDSLPQFAAGLQRST